MNELFEIVENPYSSLDPAHAIDTVATAIATDAELQVDRKAPPQKKAAAKAE